MPRWSLHYPGVGCKLQPAACKGHNFECKVSSPLAQVFGSNWWLPLKWSVELVTRAQVTHHSITNSSNQT